MYKKHHWQVSEPTFCQLHLLFDKHFAEQAELVDARAERIQTLGGVAIAMAHDVAETTRIVRVPRGREDSFRLLQAHEPIIAEAREAADSATESGDDGTNDLLVSDVLRRKRATGLVCVRTVRGRRDRRQGRCIRRFARQFSRLNHP